MIAPVDERRAPVSSSTQGITYTDPRLGFLYSTPPTDLDDLTGISGVGAVLAQKLNDEGVFTYRQIAAWSEEEMTAFGVRLAFPDRIDRDDWQGQARRLYEAKYGEKI
jgi:predicted flap endonuclease-1-like 5' DNA nuclease